ncbi:hypothetical protein TB1_014400 [Malus domestica]
MPLRFSNKRSYRGSGFRDSENGASSIFEKVIMLGVWLSRFRGRCLFDFGASNLVGSVFSNVSKGWAFLLVYLATEHREIFDRLPVISAKLSVHVTGADKAEKKANASSISEIGPRGL